MGKGFTVNTQKYHINFISQNASHAMQKKHRVKDNKQKMSIPSYVNIYTYVICDENDSK